MRVIEFNEFKNKLLEDNATRKEYDKTSAEFDLVHTIIKKRIQCGITQKDLAKQAHTTQSAISRLESGRYNPSLSFLVKISQALGSNLVVSLR